MLVSQAAIPHLRETKGWIVNLASIAGTQPVPILPIYAATKAAVISLTHSLNADLDDDGVRAIAICPGFVDTPMAEFAGLPGEEMIQPEDCAEVVRMCLRLSPRARIPQVVIERVGSSGKIALSSLEIAGRPQDPPELEEPERDREHEADDRDRVVHARHQRRRDEQRRDDHRRAEPVRDRAGDVLELVEAGRLDPDLQRPRLEPARRAGRPGAASAAAAPACV